MKNEITIIGAGHQGLSMAAHFALNGERVRLWNRSHEHISDIIKTKKIICEGTISGEANILLASDNIKDTLTRTIFVTVPTTAYKDIAKTLAGEIEEDTVIFLNPGRTFGAIEFLQELEKNGCKNMPTVAEAQSIIYTCRRFDKNTAHIYALKNGVKMSMLNSSLSGEELFCRLPECVRDRFVLADSFLETSLGNIGMILHCAPVLMNAGWIESKEHSFKYYYDGMSETVCSFVEKLDSERLEVAKMLGAKAFSLVQWFKDCYGIEGESIFECIKKNDYYREIDAPKSLSHRYLDEDVPNGLVPIETLGIEMGVDVKNISLVIDFANAVMNTDYRKSGRAYSVEKIKKYL